MRTNWLRILLLAGFCGCPTLFGMCAVRVSDAPIKKSRVKTNRPDDPLWGEVFLRYRGAADQFLQRKGLEDPEFRRDLVQDTFLALLAGDIPPERANYNLVTRVLWRRRADILRNGNRDITVVSAFENEGVSWPTIGSNSEELELNPEFAPIVRKLNEEQLRVLKLLQTRTPLEVARAMGIVPLSGYDSLTSARIVRSYDEALRILWKQVKLPAENTSDRQIPAIELTLSEVLEHWRGIPERNQALLIENRESGRSLREIAVALGSTYGAYTTLLLRLKDILGKCYGQPDLEVENIRIIPDAEGPSAGLYFIPAKPEKKSGVQTKEKPGPEEILHLHESTVRSIFQSLSAERWQLLREILVLKRDVKDLARAYGVTYDKVYCLGYHSRARLMAHAGRGDEHFKQIEIIPDVEPAPVMPPPPAGVIEVLPEQFDVALSAFPDPQVRIVLRMRIEDRLAVEEIAETLQIENGMVERILGLKTKELFGTLGITGTLNDVYAVPRRLPFERLRQRTIELPKKEKRIFTLIDRGISAEKIAATSEMGSSGPALRAVRAIYDRAIIRLLRINPNPSENTTFADRAASIISKSKFERIVNDKEDPTDRVLLKIRFEYGLSDEDISLATGIPLSVVQNILAESAVDLPSRAADALLTSP